MIRLWQWLLNLAIVGFLFFRPFTTAEPLWTSVCQDKPAVDFPFCDVSLGLEERVDDYVSRVPVENQTLMMGNRAEGYEELGIPSYQWWSEGESSVLEWDCVSR